MFSLQMQEASPYTVLFASSTASLGVRNVIAASTGGKLKTVLQVAAVFALIIWNPSPTWVDVLVYLAVAVTVASGADYFFGLRRRLSERDRETRERAGVKNAPGAP